MEQHPVPQNISSFEFRLIGDMTIKQFGLLAAGALIAYIIWELPLPAIIRMPIAAFFGIGGVAFAFLPFEDRPLHRWVLSFLKSVYFPTQYVFQKTEALPLYLRPDFLSTTQKLVPAFQVRESRQKLEAYLKTLPQSLPTSLDTKESDSLTKIQALMGTMAAIPSPRSSGPHIDLAAISSPLKLKLHRQVATPFPVSTTHKKDNPQSSPKKLAFSEGGRLLFEEDKKTIPTIPFSPTKIASRSELLVEEIKRLKESIASLHTQRPSAQTAPKDLASYEQRLSSLEKELEQAENEKEALMQMMIKLQKAAAPRQKGVTPQETLNKAPAVKIISAQAARDVGLPTLTTTPNIITGVVQGKKGGFLANILVEIKDSSGNAVRAFKTNKLGQFAAATPLENGTYTIELEDPREEFIFDIIEVKVNGSVLPPLAIYAKDQSAVEKEEIRTSLFGN